MKISLVLEGQPSELIDALQKVTNGPLTIPADRFPSANIFADSTGGTTVADAADVVPAVTETEKPKKTRKTAPKPEQGAPKPEEQAAEPDSAGQSTPEVEASKPEPKAGKKLALEDVRLVFGKKWQKDSKAVTALLAQTGHDKLTTFWGEVTDEASRVEFLNALEEI